MLDKFTFITSYKMFTLTKGINKNDFSKMHNILFENTILPFDDNNDKFKNIIMFKILMASFLNLSNLS